MTAGRISSWRDWRELHGLRFAVGRDPAGFDLAPGGEFSRAAVIRKASAEWSVQPTACARKPAQARLPGRELTSVGILDERIQTDEC